MAALAVVPPTNTNIPTFESRLEMAKQLGAKEGEGSNSQAQFVMMCIEGGYLGSLSCDPNKHGIKRCDADLLCEAYVLARGKQSRFDRKSKSGRKFVSITNKCIRFGSTPKWGRGQPMQTVQEFSEHWSNLRKQGLKNLDDYNNAMMRFATAQLRSDSLLDDETRNAFAYKSAPGTKSVAEVLEDMRKTAQKLMVGKVASCDGVDDSAEVKAVIASITKRLTDIAKNGK